MRILLCVLAVALAAVLIAVGYICLEHDIANTENFTVKAKIYLGTDNFTITSYDGYLQAETLEGEKYPTDQELNQYFKSKLDTVLIASFVAGSILIPFLIEMLCCGYSKNTKDSVR